MKQFTNESQTDKLIELGFVPNARIKEVQVVHSKINVVHDCNFTIGELIEMLPTTIMDEIWWGKEKGKDGLWGLRIDTGCTDYGWDISYERDNSAYLIVKVVASLSMLSTI